MKIYGDIAVKAAESYSKYEDMEQAWTEIAASFPIKESIRKKECPKNAFLGLCRAGLVKGINPEKVKTKHSKNGEYAVAAVSLLKMIPNGQIRKNPFSGAKLWVMKKNITASFMSFWPCGKKA